MSNQPNPALALTEAARLEGQAQRNYGLPRWYPVLSTLLYLSGVLLMIVGVFAGWFAPFVGAMLLTTNVALFPLLLASWRARGVVPRAGRLAASRYWRVAPILVPVTLIAAAVLFALAPNERIWVFLAVVIPFTVEHVYRLGAWAQR